MARLETLFDIDVSDDLKRLKEYLARRPHLAPATRAIGRCCSSCTGAESRQFGLRAGILMLVVAACNRQLNTMGLGVAQALVPLREAQMENGPSLLNVIPGKH